MGIWDVFDFSKILSNLQKLKKTWLLHAHRNQVFYIFINKSNKI